MNLTACLTAPELFLTGLIYAVLQVHHLWIVLLHADNIDVPCFDDIFFVFLCFVL